MNILKRVMVWSWRAWPVLIIVLLVVTHYLLYTSFSRDICFFNKCISLFTQLAGAGYILYSIDSNIGIINGQTLFSLFKNYLKECPLRRRTHIILEGGSSTIISRCSSAKLAIHKNPVTIDEKIEYLQEQINELKRDFSQDLIEANKKMDSRFNELRGQHEVLKNSSRDHQTKVTKIFVGGIKEQIFGALLIVYGSLSSLMPCPN